MCINTLQLCWELRSDVKEFIKTFNNSCPPKLCCHNPNLKLKDTSEGWSALLGPHQMPPGGVFCSPHIIYPAHGLPSATVNRITYELAKWQRCPEVSKCHPWQCIMLTDLCHYMSTPVHILPCLQGQRSSNGWWRTGLEAAARTHHLDVHTQHATTQLQVLALKVQWESGCCCSL